MSLIRDMSNSGQVTSRKTSACPLLSVTIVGSFRGSSLLRGMALLVANGGYNPPLRQRSQSLPIPSV
jgi:hypothetical protein